MKQIYYIAILLLTVLVFNCKETEFGYLEVDGAGYLPDTMVVRVNPDPDLDATRIAKKTPWFSTEIQGVEGTSPITYSISDVKTTDGDTESLLDNVQMKGIGIIYIPYENTLETGRYSLTVRVSNVNGDKDIEDAFILIVE